MSGCCVATEDFEEDKREEEAMMKTPVNINGVQLTLGDLFPHHYEAKEFMSRLNLIEAAKSGGADAGDE